MANLLIQTGEIRRKTNIRTGPLPPCHLIVVVPPTYPSGDNSDGYGMPFPSPQAGQQRLLEILETGGVEQPPRQAAPQGCIYSGQVYLDGAIVRNEARRQVCGQRAAAEPDASGQMPLSWRAVPGE